MELNMSTFESTYYTFAVSLKGRGGEEGERERERRRKRGEGANGSLELI